MSPFREADGCTCAMDTRAGRYYTFFNMQNIGSHVAHVQQEGPPCVLGTDLYIGQWFWGAVFTQSS